MGQRRFRSAEIFMAMRTQTQRSLLLGFIASIAFCAAVGIYCLLVGQTTRNTERILLTAASFAGTSILALLSVPKSQIRWRLVGYAGVAAAAIALGLSVIGIWIDPNWRSNFWKMLGVSWVCAVALPHLNMMSLARLRSQWNWVRTGTVIVVAALALQIIFTLVLDIHAGDEWERGMGILGIAAACGTIAVPILHKVSAIRLREAVKTTELTLQMTCPRCGKGQSLSVGKSKCAECGLGISIEIEEENCKKCGYPLYKIESAVCPECGTPIFRPAVA